MARASWRATRGNAWRLLAGTLLVSLPPAVAGVAFSLALGALAEATGSLVLGWLGDLAPVAGASIQAPLLAAFLSYAYLFLRRAPRRWSRRREAAASRQISSAVHDPAP